MRKLTLAPFFNIQLFAEGGGAPAGGDGAAAAAPAEGPQPTGVKGNPLADVQYGKQESTPDAGEKTSEDDRNSRFEELIKGEYKDLYDSRVQDTIRQRLKGNEAIVQKYNALAPMLDLLAGKYGVEPDDVDALSKAIEDDETFYEEEALEKGMSVQQVKEYRKMMRENKALKEQMEAQKNQQQADATVAAWMRDADAVKQIYPNFDFRTELQNDQFRMLIQSNIPVQTAYEVVHKDELIPAAMQFTAKQVEAKVANNVRAGQKRPAEGAASSRSAVQVKSDPSKFTKADMEEIERRVARGERIVL
jgi:hypothetical protein